MKYVVVLGDGMADYNCPELGDKTPLDVAKKPYMDKISQKGVMGLSCTVPDKYSPGSDVANLSVLGYNPADYYTGRSPLEAVSMGVSLKEEDTAFRCNLVTLSDSIDSNSCKMLDYSAGEISSEEANILIDDIQKALGSKDKKFYPGVSYRHLLVFENAPEKLSFTPPHDISHKNVKGHLPKGEGSEILLDLMRKSRDILANHPINLKRQEKGLAPANSIWLWGEGKKPYLPSFKKKYNLSGGVISAVDLIKGIAICADMEVIPVENITGNIHTNFSGKANEAIKALKEGMDFVYIHVEAPDEAGHQGNLEMKVKAIEEIDDKILKPVFNYLETLEDYKLMVLPDHFTPISTLTHARDPIPFTFCQKGGELKEGVVYSEKSAKKTGLVINEGHTIIDKFIKGF